MQYVYADVSGEIRDPAQGVSVIGLVCARSPRTVRDLLSVPKPLRDRVGRYFTNVGEFKLTAMIREYGAVRELLTQTFEKIAREPAIDIYALTVKREHQLPLSTGIILDAAIRPDEPTTFYADKGSIPFKTFFRLADGERALFGFDWNEQTASELRQRYRMNGILSATEIIPESSRQFEGIQIADLIAGAVFQKEARNDTRWFDLIQKKLVLKNAENPES